MYPLVPPEVLSVILPLLLPLHSACVVVADTVIAKGWLMVAAVVTEQPLASVTVAVYVPAGRLLRFCVVVLLLQLYVYAPVPPLTFRLTLPVADALHNALVAAGVAESVAGCDIATASVAEQLPASVTVTV